MNIKDIIGYPFEKQLELLCTIRHKDVQKYLKEYNGQHEILLRKDKTINKGKKTEETVFTAKLVVPFQKKIVRFASGFLFGSPPKYSLNDEKYKAIMDDMDRIFRENKMQYFNRRLARTVMSETHGAELWYTYTGDDKVKVRVMLLAESLGDTLYPHFDDHGDMDAFTRKYQTSDENGKPVLHADVYTAAMTYFGTKGYGAKEYEVRPEANIFGKIPVIYFEQSEPEWRDVQRLIDRVEQVISVHADVNDYYGDPVAIIKGTLKRGFDKDEPGKLLQFEPHIDETGKMVFGDAEYLTWDAMPESKKMELENLLELIHSMTSTPDLSFGSVKGIGNVSGITIRMMMMDAYLKALTNQETFGEGLLRRFNLLKAIMSSLKIAKDDLTEMEAEVSFADPLPIDYTETIEALTMATGGEALMSRETAVRKNPFVQDAEAEIEKLEEVDRTEPTENFIPAGVPIESERVPWDGNI